MAWGMKFEGEPHESDIGTVLDLRTITLQKCEAVPRRARISGS